MPRTLLWAGYVIGAALASAPTLGFELTYGDGSSALHSVAVGRTGEIVVAGTVTLQRSAEDLDFDNDAYVAAFDRAGNRLWARYYGDVGDDAFYTLTVLADGGLLLGGAWGTGGFLDSYCWVVRVAANGDVVWQQTFEAGDSCAVVALDQTAEGTIAIAGSSGLVARLGLDGEVLSSVQVEEVGTLFPSKFRTATLLGDRVFVGGVTELVVDEGSPVKPHIWALALDPNGSVAAEDVTEPGATVVRTERSGEGIWFTAIAPRAFVVGSMNPRGEWLAFGRYELDTTLPEWPSVSATFREPDGSLLVAGSGYTAARGNAALEDLAGFAGGSLRNAQGWIARIDAVGQKAWEANFGGADRSEWINAIVGLPGGGYAAVGGSGGGGFASATSAWVFTIGPDHELE